MLSVAWLPIVSIPPPETVPPFHVIEPLIARVPAVLRVPPLTARVPAIDDVEPIERKPLERSRADWLDDIVKLLTASDADEECVTVMSA